MDLSVSSMWEKYFATRDPNIRNNLVTHYVKKGLVNMIFRRMGLKNANGLEDEDYLQFGAWGLCKAIEGYDPSYNVKFETFASMKVKYEIIDRHRSHSKSTGGMSRHILGKAKAIEESSRKLSQIHKRTPTSEEICDDLGIEMKEYLEMLSQIGNQQMVSLDDFVGHQEGLTMTQVVCDEDQESPDETLTEEDNFQRLVQAIDELPDKYKEIISMHYYENMKLMTISKVLNRTPGRISQLHAEAVTHLKARLSNG